MCHNFVHKKNPGAPVYHRNRVNLPNHLNKQIYLYIYKLPNNLTPNT